MTKKEQPTKKDLEEMKKFVDNRDFLGLHMNFYWQIYWLINKQLEEQSQCKNTLSK